MWLGDHLAQALPEVPNFRINLEILIFWGTKQSFVSLLPSLNHCFKQKNRGFLTLSKCSFFWIWKNSLFFFHDRLAPLHSILGCSPFLSTRWSSINLFHLCWPVQFQMLARSSAFCPTCPLLSSSFQIQFFHFPPWSKAVDIQWPMSYLTFSNSLESGNYSSKSF